jgi:hypothetical protein
VNSDSSSSYLDDQYPDSLGAGALSIALIGPDEDRRKAAASALAGCQGGEIREFSLLPAQPGRCAEAAGEATTTSSSSTWIAIRSTLWSWWRASAPMARRR